MNYFADDWGGPQFYSLVLVFSMKVMLDQPRHELRAQSSKAETVLSKSAFEWASEMNQDSKGAGGI